MNPALTCWGIPVYVSKYLEEDTMAWTTDDMANWDYNETVLPTWTTTITLPTPDTKEAITILEEAEYELKELLKKNPTVKDVEVALRSAQSALRSLLKVS